MSSRNESALVNGLAHAFGVPGRGSMMYNPKPQQSTAIVLKSRHGGGDKKKKKSRESCDAFQLCMRSVQCPYAELVTAKFGYVFNPADPPQLWSFSIEPTTGYLQIPLTAASSLGFDTVPPKLENGMIIANWISSTPPFAADPVNNLPAAITSALYSFVGLPSTTLPFWLLKPLNYLSNATKEWQAGDWAFIQQGPYRGVSRIQFVNYTTGMVFLESPAFSEILKVCNDFCCPVIVKRCGPQRWYIKWGEIECDDGGSSSDSSNSDC